MKDKLKKGDRVRPRGEFRYGIVQQVSGSTCRVRWPEGVRVEFCQSLERSPVAVVSPENRAETIVIQESLF